MSEPERYFPEDIFVIIKTDFRFLVEKVVRSGFEYDLQPRGKGRVL